MGRSHVLGARSVLAVTGSGDRSFTSREAVSLPPLCFLPAECSVHIVRLCSQARPLQAEAGPLYLSLPKAKDTAGHSSPKTGRGAELMPFEGPWLALPTQPSPVVPQSLAPIRRGSRALACALQKPLQAAVPAGSVAACPGAPGALCSVCLVLFLLPRPPLATRLLAHKIQSPQEWEAIQALTVSHLSPDHVDATGGGQG